MRGSITRWARRPLPVVLGVITLSLVAFVAFGPRTIVLLFFETKSENILKLWFGCLLLVFDGFALIRARDEIRKVVRAGDPVALILAVAGSSLFIGIATWIVFISIRGLILNF